MEDNSYPVPNIDKLVDSSLEYKQLSFMDAYFDYNQIPMFELDRRNIAFMNEHTNYEYNMMPFGFSRFLVQIFDLLVYNLLRSPNQL